jgi:metallo-beta-lactamase class B
MSIVRIFIVASMTFFSAGSLDAQTNEPKLVITHLTGDFYIYTTYNDYNGGKVPANGMYLVTPEGVALFDTPWDNTQFQPLLDSIQKRHQQKVVFCVSTHFHDDRTAGLEYYRSKGVKTFTTAKTDKLSKQTGKSRAEYLTTKDTVFQLGAYTFEAYYPGEGHTPDNIIIWFPGEKIIYGACLIKSVDDDDLGYLGDANKQAYAATLRKVQRHCPAPRFVIVGHGNWSSVQSIAHSIEMADALKKN